MSCSDSCYVIGLVYLMRISEKILVTEYNIHRLLLISFVLATKIYDDEYFENKYYAKIGGISNKEINSMELEFVELLEFNLFVKEIEFELWKKKVIKFQAEIH